MKVLQIKAIREELIRKIWGHVYFLHNISDVWGVVLLHPDFDAEPELRSRAFAIWICGFAENAAESQNRLAHLKRLAKRIDAVTALHYIDLIEKLHAGVADVLTPLSFNDMVMIQDHRNRAVHGELNATHRRVPYSDGKFVHTKRLTSVEIHAICTGQWAREGWEPQLIRARIEVLSRPSLFWFIHDGMLASRGVARIMEDLKQWDIPVSPGVLIEFIENSYEATQAAFKNDLRTFWFNRAGTTKNQDRRLDPAVAIIEDRIRASSK